MLDFLLSPSVQLVLMTFILVIMTIFGAMVVARFRNFNDDDQPTTSQLLSNFQELHDQGDIDEAEFRKLKTVLGDKLPHELKDTGETG